jgi:hypothetical protein
MEEILQALVAQKQEKNLFAESPRFPVPGSSGQGQSAPKAQPRGEADGNQVNIPEPMPNMVTDLRDLRDCQMSRPLRPMQVEEVTRKTGTA